MDLVAVAFLIGALVIYKHVVVRWLGTQVWRPTLQGRMSPFQGALWIALAVSGVPTLLIMASTMLEGPPTMGLMALFGAVWSVSMIAGTLSIRAFLGWQLAHPSKTDF